MKCIYVQAFITVSFIAFSILFGVVLGNTLKRKSLIATKGMVTGYSAVEDGTCSHDKKWTGYVDVNLYLRRDGGNATAEEICVESLPMGCGNTREEALNVAKRSYPFEYVDELHPLENRCFPEGMIWFRAGIFGLCIFVTMILLATLIIRIIRKRRRAILIKSIEDSTGTGSRMRWEL